MYIPRLDPLPPVIPTEPVVRPKPEERASVATPVTAAQLEPVGSRTNNQGRDPTLDPSRQRRERGERSLEEEKKRRGEPRRPSTRPPEGRTTPVPAEVLERAVTGTSSQPPPAIDLTATALDMLSEWGRERLHSGDVLDAAPLSDRPSAPPSAGRNHVHDPVDCAYCKSVMRAYKQT